LPATESQPDQFSVQEKTNLNPQTDKLTTFKLKKERQAILITPAENKEKLFSSNKIEIKKIAAAQKIKRNLMPAKHLQKIKEHNQRAGYNLWNKINESLFFDWLFLLIIPPVFVMRLGSGGFWTVFLYTLGWAAGLFCIFYFIPILWLCFALIPFWGIASFALGLTIYLRVS
jgi:hypothetical protein